MSLLAVTYTFSPGGVIRASEHNQNMQDIITWGNGNIDNTNLGVFSGTVTWNVTTNVKSISSINTGTAGSASFQQNGTLSTGLSALSVSSNAAQSLGAALVSLTASSASNNIPSLLITDAGAGGRGVIEVVSTTKASLPYPKMTTSQRNAMTAPAEGMGIYNSTNKRYEMYDGTNWVDMAGKTGTSAEWSGATIPPDALLEDGTAYSTTTYAALFAKIGTTWNTFDGQSAPGAGLFRVPKSSGRAVVASGTGSGLTARTLADSGGEETHVLSNGELAAHFHWSGAVLSDDSSLEMGIRRTSNSGFYQNRHLTNVNVRVGQGSGNQTFNNGEEAGTDTATANGTNDAHNNMQPFIVKKKIIYI